MTALTRRPAAWLFALTAALVYLVVYFVTRTPQAISHAALISTAALFDLSVTLSIACYVLLPGMATALGVLLWQWAFVD
ncbi:MAG: hypothetical protein JO150_17315 [Acidobacteriaceae bacterium]|nr:hypothetical protein [Acidobacteriaceae bacterium]